MAPRGEERCHWEDTCPFAWMARVGGDVRVGLSGLKRRLPKGFAQHAKSAERETLLAHVRTLGLAERVHFAGWTTDVLPFLWAADAFALPSHTEGMPNALLEAMATGLPCVATTVGGSRGH